MLFRKKCGIDLGSDTIKIADKKNKKVVCEKNMIAVRDKTYVIAVGQRAYEMYEKTPLCVTEKPKAFLFSDGKAFLLPFAGKCGIIKTMAIPKRKDENHAEIHLSADHVPEQRVYPKAIWKIVLEIVPGAFGRCVSSGGGRTAGHRGQYFFL